MKTDMVPEKKIWDTPNLKVFVTVERITGDDPKLKNWGSGDDFWDQITTVSG